MVSSCFLKRPSIKSFFVFQSEYKAFNLVTVVCFSIGRSFACPLLCCFKALANSSALANSEPCKPNAARHLPKELLKQFSNALVLFINDESLFSSA